MFFGCFFVGVCLNVVGMFVYVCMQRLLVYNKYTYTMYIKPHPLHLHTCSCTFPFHMKYT